MSKFAVFLLFVIASAISQAQTTTAEPSVVDPRISILEEQVIRLEEQNRILLSTSNDIRNSYYWALGFASTFLLLFLGVNIYFFRNRYSEEKESLMMHIEAKVMEANLTNLAAINVKSEATEKELEEKLSAKIKSITSTFSNGLASLRNAIQEHEIEILELELVNTKRSGVKANELTSYLRLAKEIRKMSGTHWDWNVSECLGEICKLLDEGVSFESMELPELTEFLNGLPNQFGDAVANIRKRIH